MNADLCVIGAGPAGAAAAASAAAAGASVVLVAASPARQLGLELLSGCAAHGLGALGVLDAVRATETPCTGTVSRWGGREFVARPSILDPWGGGWIVDRFRLDALLVGAAIGAGARLIRGRALRVERQVGGLRVLLRDVDHGLASMHASRVVIATGRPGSLVRPWVTELDRAAGGRIVALTAALPAGEIEDLGHQLLIDRVANGWWYALATPDVTAIAYCTDGDQIGSGRPGLLNTWRQVCRETDWLPQTALLARPAVRSRILGRGPSPTDAAVQTVGDAAFSVDPLSGHGLALAIEGGLQSQDPEVADTNWYDEVAAAHRAQEPVVYGNAPKGAGPFWQRRAAG